MEVGLGRAALSQAAGHLGLLLTAGWAQGCSTCPYFGTLAQGTAVIQDLRLLPDHQSLRHKPNHIDIYKASAYIISTTYWLKQVMWPSPTSVEQESICHHSRNRRGVNIC